MKMMLVQFAVGFSSSTSVSGGHQVDGSPPVRSPPRGALRAILGGPPVRLVGAKHSPSDPPPGGPFGQNRGVLHSTWSGPLWTPRTPVQIHVLNQSRILIIIIFNALSDGVLIFSWVHGKYRKETNFWHHLGSFF